MEDLKISDSRMVSIIMLSKDKAQFLQESVNSVLAQTYTNWELIFVDDSSTDSTIHNLMVLKDGLDKSLSNKIKVTKTVYVQGKVVNRNSAMKQAHGKWIAFLDAGDLWEPTKLERQVKFMTENGFAFSYTKFRSIDERMRQGRVMSGPDRVSAFDMLKCCWMGYLTVMFDREKIGLIQVNGLKEANDYALWMQVAEKADCYLLRECLASQMSEGGLMRRLLISKKWMWRYEAYRKIEKANPIKATYYTIRNLAWTGWKWWRYGENMSNKNN